MQSQDEIPEESIPESDMQDQTWGDPPPFVGRPSSPVQRAESQFHEDLQRFSRSDDPLLARGTLGRYQLIRKIGQGAMGTVYSAHDPLLERSVAIKILRAEVSQSYELRRRFEREARLLAEIQSIHVTRLFEVTEIAGFYCVVQELVDGQTLAEFVKTQGPLTELKALAISIDIATALIELHSHGIVHRDVKPENILLCDLSHSEHNSDLMESLAKLADFGIARQNETSESIALTSAESLLGTPLYMSPEQFYGGSGVDHRSDLYSLGATLFYAITGQPPFQSDNTLGLADAHRHSPIPDAQTFNKQLSDGFCAVIFKSLQKREDLRYQSATELKDDLLRLQRGQATNIASHPLLPTGDAGRMAAFTFTWELNCTPEALWPFVSDTERLNRAIGLPAVSFSVRQTESGQRQRFAEVRFAGLLMNWQEHMFEWIEARRLSVLREYQRGPLRWLVSAVELNRRAEGGTTLTHTFKASCRHLPGFLFAKFQLGTIIKRALDRAYRRIDVVVGDRQSAESMVDAYEESRPLGRRSNARLQEILDRLCLRNLNRTALLKVTEFVASGSAQEISRIRPRALAGRLRLPVEQVVDVCLHGAQEELFDLSWEVICPSCRIAAHSHDAMANIKNHTQCEGCGFDFEVDFSSRVELVFRTNPRIRDLETGHYCIGGPGHSPHVIAQTRVAAGETINVGLELPEGRYILRGPQLPFSIHLNVTSGAQQNQLLVELSEESERPSAIELKTERQLITIVNHGAHEVVVRVERSALVDDSFTALQAASLPFFRTAFPAEIPSAQQIVSIQKLTFMIVRTEVCGALAAQFGELRSCELLRSHLEQLSELAVRCDGSFIRPLGDGAILVFKSCLSALQAAMLVSETVPCVGGAVGWQPVVAVHEGSVMVTTLNGQLEYLGSAPRVTELLSSAGRAGNVIVVRELADQIVSPPFEDCALEEVPDSEVSLSAIADAPIVAVLFRRAPERVNEDMPQ